MTPIANYEKARVVRCFSPVHQEYRSALKALEKQMVEGAKETGKVTICCGDRSQKLCRILSKTARRNKIKVSYQWGGVSTDKLHRIIHRVGLAIEKMKNDPKCKEYTVAKTNLDGEFQLAVWDKKGDELYRIAKEGGFFLACRQFEKWGFIPALL